MAEFVMRDLVKKQGHADSISIKSSATSTWEIGNPVYPPAAAELARHGISCNGKHAEKLTAQDYGKYDMFICMDRQNLRDSIEIFGGDPDGKVSMLLSHAGEAREVADPWYTGDFSTAYSDIVKGCTAILAELFGD